MQNRNCYNKPIYVKGCYDSYFHAEMDPSHKRHWKAFHKWWVFRKSTCSIYNLVERLLRLSSLCCNVTIVTFPWCDAIREKDAMSWLTISIFMISVLSDFVCIMLMFFLLDVSWVSLSVTHKPRQKAVTKTKVVFAWLPNRFNIISQASPITKQR